MLNKNFQLWEMDTNSKLLKQKSANGLQLELKRMLEKVTKLKDQGPKVMQ